MVGHRRTDLFKVQKGATREGICVIICSISGQHHSISNMSKIHISTHIEPAITSRRISRCQLGHACTLEPGPWLMFAPWFDLQRIFTVFSGVFRYLHADIFKSHLAVCARSSCFTDTYYLFAPYIRLHRCSCL